MQSLVSIITASYNAEKYIEQTVKSVQAQTYQNWEMLITDDCSTDNTCQIVQNLADKDSRIKLFKLKQNAGPAVARNNSIKEAKGRFIAFLDADDLWLPEKLRIQLSQMIKHKVSVSFTSYLQIDENGKEIGKKIVALKNLTYKKLLKNNYIGNLTGIYDCDRLGKIYNPLIRKRQDWCLWLYALKKSTKPALGIQKPLAKYRISLNSISSNKLNLIKYNFLVYYQQLNYNILKSIFYLFLFSIEYFIIRKKFIVNYEKKLNEKA
ncbi:glycosyltransferase family 2 protein [Psychroflexus sp. MBR-150]|jgi:glycosyltransferase involved in cell wall biosynthesis